MSSAAAVKVIRANFNLSRTQFYYARRKWATQLPIPEYLERLKEDGYKVIHSEWEAGFSLPVVLLIMSPTHKQVYDPFGDAVSFDITYKLVNNFVYLRKMNSK